MTRLIVPLLLGLRTGWRNAFFVFAVAALLLPILVRGVWAQEAAQSVPQHPVGLDARDAQGLTLLIVAASEGQAETVRTLLVKGAQINATAADGRTALIAAVEGSRMEVIQALIAAGADLNTATRGNGTALNLAENRGEMQIAALLLASGAHSSGKSIGDTVCVRPWAGDGFCGTVKSFSIPLVEIQVTKIMGCANGCSAKEECSASKPVGGTDGLQVDEEISVPSWCLTQTGVKP